MNKDYHTLTDYLNPRTIIGGLGLLAGALLGGGCSTYQRPARIENLVQSPQTQQEKVLKHKILALEEEGYRFVDNDDYENAKDGYVIETPAGQKLSTLETLTIDAILYTQAKSDDGGKGSSGGRDDGSGGSTLSGGQNRGPGGMLK